MECALQEVVKMKGSPFSEYREEQVRVNIFEYFVEPSFFDQFCDSKPMLIYGSRGSGKTTLFKALCASETQDIETYLQEKTYFGVYYRIDLNVTASFSGYGIPNEKWEKIFAHYIVSALSYELLKQFNSVRSTNKLSISESDEQHFAKKYGRMLSNRENIENLVELEDLFENELHIIRDFINNCPCNSYPHIGDYAAIINGMSEDLLHLSTDYNFAYKTVFYLIDEFEGLSEWQQKIVLSFVKYANDWHTFKICMRPDGLKTAQTVGKEYIRETDDIKSIELDRLFLKDRKQLYKYALEVCEKRMDLFYKRNNTIRRSVPFDKLLESLPEDEEKRLLLKGREDKARKNIESFFESEVPEAVQYFSDKYFDFLLFKLLYIKSKSKGKTKESFWSSFKYDNYTSDSIVINNYKKALLYNTYLCFSKQIIYAGFDTLVDISGGTIRYLLEICNEIFERAVANGNFDYASPSPIPYTIQTAAIYEISNKRVRQISAIPQIGPNIRTFVIALGQICRAYHKEEKISKIEPNHFSLKSTDGGIDDNVIIFLRECVTRGILIKKKNNKKKNTDIGFDEYLYMLHPIYAPSFNISWRRKQKLEFTVEEISSLASNNTKAITEIVKQHEQKTKTNTRSDSQLIIEEYDED